MANFDTSLSNSSFVKYLDNGELKIYHEFFKINKQLSGTSFTVVWENVYLQDKMDIGAFTFSATLYDTGNIVFVYYNVPILIESIQDDKHPVKVGLSDAYIIDKVIFCEYFFLNKIFNIFGLGFPECIYRLCFFFSITKEMIIIMSVITSNGSLVQVRKYF